MKTAVGIALALLLGGCASEGARSHLVKAETLCEDQTTPIYFDANSAEVTREAKLVLAQAASRQAGCKVTSVEVLGLSDAAGAPDANLELSKRRADAVAALLAADGLPPADFRVGAAGQAGAVSADGKAAPLRRRVEVTFHMRRG